MGTRAGLAERNLKCYSDRWLDVYYVFKWFRITSSGGLICWR